MVALRPGPAMAVVAALILAGCGSARPTLTSHAIVSGGVAREWYQFEPSGLATPAPLVVTLHGLGETPNDLAPNTGLDAEAARDGFVVVYPAGVQASWNAGQCCGAAAGRGIDDDAFLAALIARLVAAGTVDRHRVYVVGFSNGAMMTFRFACDRAGLLAGAAAIEGTLAEPCPAHPPVNFLLIHQSGDTVVPVNGTQVPGVPYGDAHPFMPIGSALEEFTRAEGCTAAAVRQPGSAADPVATETFACPGHTVTRLDLITGGSHSWPRTPSPLDATADIAVFFGLRR